MNYYLNKYTVRNQLIPFFPSERLGIVIVIPCCNEPDLLTSLESIFNCSLPECDVEVITVINASENAEKRIIDQNVKTLKNALSWKKSNMNNQLNYFFIEENNLPKKHAGVGLARKIGMDEAVRRFEAINKPEGIILCFDADAKCDKNYLVAIEKHFEKHVKSPACSIHFEHPIKGSTFPQDIYKGIIQYELHLRVYKNGLAYAKLPYAYHTIGSSMAVKSSAYQKQNGMNKRKAGEDFYFLQKLIPLGGFSEIKNTTVIPSPRTSDRVPFGTGKAMQKIIDDRQENVNSYNLNSYIDLKQFCDKISALYENDSIELSNSIKAFVETIDWKNNIEKIRKNSTSKEHFKKLFFNWFNAFKVLKYMHFSRENFYVDVNVFDVANELVEQIGGKRQPNLISLLNEYRRLDKSV